MPSEKHELIITLIDHIAKRQGFKTERGVRTVEGVQPDLRITKSGLRPIHLEVQTDGNNLTDKIDQCKKAHAEPLIIDGRNYNLDMPLKVFYSNLLFQFREAMIIPNSPLGFTTTIKKKYWKEKMEMVKEKGYFYEYKQDSDFWNKRLNKLSPPCDGTFLIGTKVHKVNITEIIIRDTNIFFKIPPSEIKTDKTWRLTCYLKCLYGHDKAWSGGCNYCTPDNGCLCGKMEVDCPLRG